MEPRTSCLLSTRSTLSYTLPPRVPFGRGLTSCHKCLASLWPEAEKRTLVWLCLRLCCTFIHRWWWVFLNYGNLILIKDRRGRKGVFRCADPSPMQGRRPSPILDARPVSTCSFSGHSPFISSPPADRALRQCWLQQWPGKWPGSLQTHEGCYLSPAVVDDGKTPLCLCFPAGPLL